MSTTRARPKFSAFTITVKPATGPEVQYTLKAADLEDAAKRACRKGCLDRRAKPKRTTGSEGLPGWFYPEVPGAWPFGGNSYHVEPEAKP